MEHFKDTTTIHFAGIMSEPVSVHVEVSLLPTCRITSCNISSAVTKFLSTSCYILQPGPVSFSRDDFLNQNLHALRVADFDDCSSNVVFFHQAKFHITSFVLNTTGGESETLEDDGEDGETPALINWPLPSLHFDGMWEALIYDQEIKNRLLRYSETALRFSDAKVNSNYVTWNRVVLLHGPPGSGKTSLCKALAHKLSIVLKKRYHSSYLVEINAHSLFSRWFSESGKLVLRLFDSIFDMLADSGTFIVVLIDEVESLSASRKAALSGSEPSDAIRVVNALLTQIDRIGKLPNVLITCTTNITSAVDLAFVDRADLKVYLGPPSVRVIYTLFRQSITSLIESHLLLPEELPLEPENCDSDVGKQLLTASEKAFGFSGRTLRKLPFIAFAFFAKSKDILSVGSLSEHSRVLLFQNMKIEVCYQIIK
ncbi:hypothetical protein GEMRC1_003843 [Eukaryota sp. GEM-RC1]